jgi:hypothetical protein
MIADKKKYDIGRGEKATAPMSRRKPARKVTPKKAAIAADIEMIRHRLQVCRCSEPQVQLHVSRLQTIRTKPKVNHDIAIDGNHRSAFKT